MPLVHFDASAFVKLLTTETGGSLACALWDGCDAALSNRLAYPEVRAALAAATRDHDLTETELATAERDWDDYWAATRPIELTATVEQHAGHLARAHALRGADAVHLASALAVGERGLIVAVGTAACIPEPKPPGAELPPHNSTPSPAADDDQAPICQVGLVSQWRLQLREAIDQVCEPRWQLLAQRGFSIDTKLRRCNSLICVNVGGRGRYRTADRWCVKPELYH
ncbi:MAG: uncharacterized protein QOK02_4365 [Mycobacterium sp.]|nr:uncharacterized protein [Mycobacterium sp.]